MNRIALGPNSIGPDSFTTTEDSIETATLAIRRSGTPTRPPHAIFVPMHYEPGYSYPLVVWLHGSAGNEQQLRKVMPLVSMRNYVAVAPRATSAQRKHQNAFRWRQTSEDIEAAEARILDCIAIAARRFSIHRKRVFLAGFGTGGTMAVRIAWNNPAQFAGVASIGGSLPSEGSPLRRVNELRHLPCLLATTRNSREYPEPRVCQDLRLLHAAGCTVALRQYPGGDDLTTSMLSDFDRWMMELVCGGKHAGC
jgi:phospholipase/carboxylesterase